MLAPKTNLSLFLTTIFLLPACTWFDSDIQKIDTLAQAEPALNKATSNTLVVFDMDQTLMDPTEQMFEIMFRPITEFDLADRTFLMHLRKKHPEVAREHDSTRRIQFLSALFAKTNFTPVEKITVPLITALQARGVKVIALTSSNTGTFGSIKNMQEWRLRNLHQLGLDFSTSFAQQEIEFTNFPKEYGFYPVFYRGIICASLNLKGPMLAAFLERIDWRPANIIFFDDHKEQCESVAHEMKKLGIPTISYWYRAAYLNKIKLDQQTIQRQIDYWAAHKVFLSSQEISKTALANNLF